MAKSSSLDSSSSSSPSSSCAEPDKELALAPVSDPATGARHAEDEDDDKTQHQRAASDPDDKDMDRLIKPLPRDEYGAIDNDDDSFVPLQSTGKDREKDEVLLQRLSDNRRRILRESRPSPTLNKQQSAVEEKRLAAEKDADAARRLEEKEREGARATENARLEAAQIAEEAKRKTEEEREQARTAVRNSMAETSASEAKVRQQAANEENRRTTLEGRRDEEPVISDETSHSPALPP